MKRVKKFGVIWLLNKSEERSEKRVVFCSYRCFWEREKLMCEKIFSERAKFFVHVRLLKAVFCNFSCLWGLIMILYWIWARSERNWRFHVVNWSFMQIWRFLISFADFSTKFNVFWPFVFFTALSAICIEARYSKNIRDTNWLQFCWYKTFFLKKNDRKIENFLTTFLICFFFVFFSVVDNFFSLLWLAHYFSSNYLLYLLKVTLFGFIFSCKI